MAEPANPPDGTTEFPPEKRLEATNTRLIDAGITTIRDMETLRECVAYENTHQNRTLILKRLARKATELRDEQQSSTGDTERG
ncbi:hypothetical protein [Haloferax sp. KTX1]|uniref:hypothetical protein n=1 Tax=Haloferax sp. KTX1 TaxID=2600597 RepID=UPI0011DDC376|nr:hypothetical protein [Haloferax sp. KTX1]